MHSEKAEPWESPAWGKLRERLCLPTRPSAEPWMWSCKENSNQVGEGGSRTNHSTGHGKGHGGPGGGVAVGMVGSGWVWACEGSLIKGPGGGAEVSLRQGVSLHSSPPSARPVGPRTLSPASVAPGHFP